MLWRRTRPAVLSHACGRRESWLRTGFGRIFRRENRRRYPLHRARPFYLGKIVGKKPGDHAPFTSRVLKEPAQRLPVLITGESRDQEEVVCPRSPHAQPRSKGPGARAGQHRNHPSEPSGKRILRPEGAFTGSPTPTSRDCWIKANQAFCSSTKVAELPLNMQVKLLPLPRQQGVRAHQLPWRNASDIHLVAATNRDRSDPASTTGPCADFFFRLFIIPIHPAAAAGLKENIPLLMGKGFPGHRTSGSRTRRSSPATSPTRLPAL